MRGRLVTDKTVSGCVMFGYACDHQGRRCQSARSDAIAKTRRAGVRSCDRSPAFLPMTDTRHYQRVHASHPEASSMRLIRGHRALTGCVCPVGRGFHDATVSPERHSRMAMMTRQPVVHSLSCAACGKALGGRTHRG